MWGQVVELNNFCLHSDLIPWLDRSKQKKGKVRFKNNPEMFRNTWEVNRRKAVYKLLHLHSQITLCSSSKQKSTTTIKMKTAAIFLLLVAVAAASSVPMKNQCQVNYEKTEHHFIISIIIMHINLISECKNPNKYLTTAHRKTLDTL